MQQRAPLPNCPQMSVSPPTPPSKPLVISFPHHIVLPFSPPYSSVVHLIAH